MSDEWDWWAPEPDLDVEVKPVEFGFHTLQRMADPMNAKNPGGEIRHIGQQCELLGIETVVETGTFLGETTMMLARMPGIRDVRTIEASESLWREAIDNARKFETMAPIIDGRPLTLPITFIHGESPAALFRLFDECPALADEPICFYLDAHFCKDDERAAHTGDRPPLFDELALIADRDQADLVWVDDVHTFGMDRADLGQSWRQITKDTIRAALGDRVQTLSVIHDGLAITMKGK